MFTKTYLLPLAVMLLSMVNVDAQNRTFEDVIEIRLENVGPIFQNNQVIGYYAFYYIDKAAEIYKSNYKLVLMDEQLNKIAEKKIVETDRLELHMASYNGKNLFFVFQNNYSVEFRLYDLALNLISTEQRPFFYLDPFSPSNPTKRPVLPQVISLGDNGFLFYNYTRNTISRKLNYKIQFFPTNGSNPWQWETQKSDNLRYTPVVLCHNDKILLHHFIEGLRPSTYLQGINLKTGKVLFRKEMSVENHLIQIVHAHPDTAGNFVVAGQYYNLNDKVWKDKSLGFFVGKIDSQGNFITHKFLSWINEVAAKTIINKKGLIRENDNLYLHNAVHGRDGSIYLMGEIFEKTKSTLKHKSVFKTKEIAVIEISPDWALKSFNFFNKTEHKHTMPFWIKNLEKQVYYYQNFRGFDYQYFLQNEQRDEFAFFYEIRYTEDNKLTRKLSTLSKHIGENKFVTDIISLDSDATIYRVMPAYAGHIMIVEYFSNTKKLNMRIEKFNY